MDFFHLIFCLLFALNAHTKALVLFVVPSSVGRFDESKKKTGERKKQHPPTLGSLISSLSLSLSPSSARLFACGCVRSSFVSLQHNRRRKSEEEKPASPCIGSELSFVHRRVCYSHTRFHPLPPPRTTEEGALGCANNFFFFSFAHKKQSNK